MELIFNLCTKQALEPRRRRSHLRMQMAEIKAIRTEVDYLAALREVSALIDLDPAADSPEGERLDVLGTLVQAYEAKHFPIDPPDPIEAIKLRMEQSGMTVKDLVPYIGPLNRVYEVLSGKRSLSLGMIRRLSDGLHIPAEVLIREPEAVTA